MVDSATLNILQIMVDNHAGSNTHAFKVTDQEYINLSDDIKKHDKFLSLFGDTYNIEVIQEAALADSNYTPPSWSVPVIYTNKNGDFIISELDPNDSDYVKVIDGDA